MNDYMIGARTSLIRKMFLVCDKCGERAEMPFAEIGPSGGFPAGDAPEGRLSPDRASASPRTDVV